MVNKSRDGQLHFSRIIGLLIIFSGIALLAREPDSRGFQFLQAGYNARFRALGQSAFSGTRDVGGLLINPAGLANLKSPQFSLNYSNMLLDLNGGFAAFGYPIGIFGTAGIGAIYLDYGEFKEINRNGIFTGEIFESRDFAFLAAWAGNFDDNFSYGINVKFAHSQIGDFSAGAVLLDAGVLYRLQVFSELNFSLVLTNWGNNFDRFLYAKTELPTNLAAGLSKKWTNMPLTMYMGFKSGLSPGRLELYENYQLSAGLEYVHSNYLDLRLGYNEGLSRELQEIGSTLFTGFSAGIGLHLGKDRFDYSYSDYGELGAEHLFGFTFQFDLKKSSNVHMQKSAPENFYEKYTPYNVKTRVVGDKIIIYWKGHPEAKFQVYARFADRTDWVRLTPKPVRKQYVVYEKPQVPGEYLFRVVGIVGNRSSRYSETIRYTLR